MRKTLTALALVVCCLLALGLASAETVDLSTDLLPACYRYVIVGAAHVYASGDVTVYADKDAATPVGTVSPDQSIHVDQVDEESGMTYIYYYDDGRLPTWASQDARTGWMETRHIFNKIGLNSLNDAMVVTTNVPGNRLNLRDKPSASSNSHGKYYAGTIVRRLDSGSNGFVHVQIGHQTGYMKRDFLAAGLYTETAELPELTVDTADGDPMNLHKLPRRSSETIKDVEDGETVTVLGIRADGWYQLSYENEIGFGRSDELSTTLRYKLKKKK